MSIIRYKGKNYTSSADDIFDSELNYESGDELDPSGPAEVPKLESKETLKSFTKKVSTAVKNVRYLLKMLGSMNISAIGDGTLTGAVNALESGKADTDGIVLTGDVTGTSAFNAETGKTEISAQRRRCHVYRGGLAGTDLGWYKIASKEYDAVYMDFSISFLVSCTYMGLTNTGILRVMVRTQPSGGFQKYKIEIPYSAGLTPSDFILGLYTNQNGRPVAEIYCKNVIQYLCITFDVLAEAVTSCPSDTWTLYSYNGGPGITEIPSSYVQIPATLAMIQNPIATEVLNSTSDIFSDITTDNIDVETGEVYLYKSSANMSLFMYFKMLNRAENMVLGHLMSKYRPKKGGYAIGSLRSVVSPYVEIGTIWFFGNGTGAFKAYMKDGLTYPLTAYTQVVWII